LQLPSHGANPHLLYESLHLPIPNDWIDFSVNTNPYKIPIKQMPSQEEIFRWIMEYPDPEAVELKCFLAEMDGIKREQILIGNGASQCIYMLAQLFSGKRVGVMEPTFSEYRAACLANHCQVISIVTSEEQHWKYDLNELEKALKEVDVLFLCQPNNPTGTVFSEMELYSILKLAEKSSTHVVIDEAFYHFWIDSFSALQWLDQFPKLIVIRSLTKMYHLAGIRVGYIAADEVIIQKLKAIQPPWSVNHVAQQLSLRLLRMISFVETTKQAIAQERKRVTNILRNADYYVSPSVVNFYLIREPLGRTEKLMRDMLKVGLIPRHTYNFPRLDGRYLRLAVRTKEENDRLLDFLVGWKR
jgi:threonine-phosphate decarboxylase